MNETIEKLIASGMEGPWWDFKQTYHQNNAALVHDILCMANVLHDGDRYLIFGVTDKGLITGVPEDSKQLNQANLIDLLRKVSFWTDPTTVDISCPHDEACSKASRLAPRR